MKAIALLCISALVLAASSCSLPSGPATGTVNTLDAATIQQILDAHNAEKINTPVPTEQGNLYTWSADLQRNAEALGKRCVFQHSSSTCRSNIANYAQVGENLAIGSSPTYDGSAGIKKLIDSWIAEKSQFSWSGNTCSGTCGHYTQVVWGNSKQVGCAFVKCPAASGILGSFVGQFLVCQYGPAGNFNNEWPQKKATSTSPGIQRPCGIGGLCSYTAGATACTCVCMNGFTLQGNTCVKGSGTTTTNPTNPTTTPPTNPCTANSCAVNGVCTNDNGKAKCTCSNNYSGTRCDVPPNPCVPNPCAGGATCTANGGQYSCAAAPPPPPPPPVPSQPPIVPAVFAKIAALSGGKFSVQDAALRTSALAESNKCGPTGSSSMSVMLCGFDTVTDAADVDMYAQMIVDMVAGYNPFWKVARKAAVAMDTSITCGGCDYGMQNRALTFTWNTPSAEVMTTTNDPMDWKLVTRGAPDVPQLTRRQPLRTAFIAGGGVFIVAAIITGLIVYRRRQQQQVEESNYSELTL